MLIIVLEYNDFMYNEHYIIIIVRIIYDNFDM